MSLCHHPLSAVILMYTGMIVLFPRVQQKGYLLVKILIHEAVNWYKHKESIVSVTKHALTGGTCLIRCKLNVNLKKMYTHRHTQTHTHTHTM